MYPYYLRSNYFNVHVRTPSTVHKLFKLLLNMDTYCISIVFVTLS